MSSLIRLEFPADHSSSKMSHLRKAVTNALQANAKPPMFVSRLMAQHQLAIINRPPNSSMSEYTSRTSVPLTTKHKNHAISYSKEQFKPTTSCKLRIRRKSMPKLSSGIEKLTGFLEMPQKAAAHNLLLQCKKITHESKMDEFYESCLKKILGTGPTPVEASKEEEMEPFHTYEQHFRKIEQSQANDVCEEWVRRRVNLQKAYTFRKSERKTSVPQIRGQREFNVDGWSQQA